MGELHSAVNIVAFDLGVLSWESFYCVFDDHNFHILKATIIREILNFLNILIQVSMENSAFFIQTLSSKNQSGTLHVGMD